ncbi:hypothetical protein FA13DRAFT_1738322, partial [Coprinellus micaceus]
MDPRTHQKPRYAGATWNTGLNNWQNIHRNDAPNPFFVTQDFFPRGPAPIITQSYRALGARLPPATGYDSYAPASSSKATPLQQPDLLARFSKCFEDAKPKTQKRVHFEVVPPETPTIDFLPLFTSLYAFFVAATFIILGALAHCIIGAVSFTLQVIQLQCTSVSKAWRVSWYPWLENRWKSWRLGFEVRPLPQMDRTQSYSYSNQRHSDYWTHRLSAKHHMPRNPLPERSRWQNLKATFAQSVNLVKQCSVASFSWCLQTTYHLLSLSLHATIQIPSIIIAAGTQFILSLGHAIAQLPSLTYSAASKSLSSLYQTTLNATDCLYDIYLDISEWWNPLPTRPSTVPSNQPSTLALERAPSPDRAKLARALGRRRRRVTPEQSGSSSAPIPQPTNPAPSSSSTNPTSTSTQAPAIRRPKSLQHARQWRDLAASSSSSNPASSSTSAPPKPLPRIDLHLQVARHALSAFSKLRQFFSYPGSSSPQFQALMEELYDNPVLVPQAQISSEATMVRAPSPDQPGLVVHQMCWQGEQERVGEVLGVALATMLTRLVIGNCEVGVGDVVAILGA